MQWSVRGLGHEGSRFFNFCGLKLEIGQTRPKSVTLIKSVDFTEFDQFRVLTRFDMFYTC